MLCTTVATKMVWEKNKSLKSLQAVERSGALSPPVPPSPGPRAWVISSREGVQARGVQRSLSPLDPIGCSLYVWLKPLLPFLGSLLCFIVQTLQTGSGKGCVHTMESEMRDVSKRLSPQSPFLLSFSVCHFTLSHFSPLSDNLSPSEDYV